MSSGFIGSPKMNFLSGTVVGAEDGRVLVSLNAFGAMLDADVSGRALPAGTPVTVGIRPEHLEIAEAGDGRLNVASDVAEQLGDVSYIYAEPQQDEQLVIARRGTRGFTKGETLGLWNDASRTYLFDREGLRIR